jgi:GntR family transcriptional repressor for pyruvate dehydrogenase complex
VLRRADVIGALRVEVDRMIAAGDRVNELVATDAAFHDVIARAPGNGVLRALLRSLSTSTVRARLWRGIAERGALDLARDWFELDFALSRCTIARSLGGE